MHGVLRPALRIGGETSEVELPALCAETRATAFRRRHRPTDRTRRASACECGSEANSAKRRHGCLVADRRVERGDGGREAAPRVRGQRNAGARAAMPSAGPTRAGGSSRASATPPAAASMPAAPDLQPQRIGEQRADARVTKCGARRAEGSSVKCRGSGEGHGPGGGDPSSRASGDGDRGNTTPRRRMDRVEWGFLAATFPPTAAGSLARPVLAPRSTAECWPD